VPAVYGKNHVLPCRGDAAVVLEPPDTAWWGYATSERLDEFLAIAYARQHDLPVTVVRLFTTVGPRQSSRHGIMLPNFVRWSLAGEPISVHGDGTQTGSFTWVGDVVWAMMALINEPRAVGEVFDVGSGEEISIRDLALKGREMTASSSELQFTSEERAFECSVEGITGASPTSRSCAVTSVTSRASIWTESSRMRLATGMRRRASRRVRAARGRATRW
jgi:UDP-glucose 4-epimerase